MKLITAILVSFSFSVWAQTESMGNTEEVIEAITFDNAFAEITSSDKYSS